MSSGIFYDLGKAHPKLYIWRNQRQQLKATIPPMKTTVFIFFIVLWMFAGLAAVSTASEADEAEIERYKKIISENPNDAAARNSLGLIYKKLKRYNEALAEFKEVKRLDPNYPDVRVNLGAVYIKLGQHPTGKREYQEALKINPKDPKAHHAVAAFYYMLQRYPVSLPKFQEVARLTPNDPKAHYNLGLNYNKLKKYEDAIASFKEALRLDPGYAGAYLMLGSVYNSLKDGRNAVIHTLKAGKLYEKQNNEKGKARSERNLEKLLEKYELKREDFEDVKSSSPPQQPVSSSTGEVP